MGPNRRGFRPSSLRFPNPLLSEIIIAHIYLFSFCYFIMDIGAGLRRALAKLTGAAIVDEKVLSELIKDIQRALLSGDVNVELVLALTKKIEERAKKEKAQPGISMKEHVVKVVYDELVALMGESHEPKLAKQKILLLGLFGSGKTTTAAKLAKFYQERGLSTGVVCCDVSRPAAYEQLSQLAQKIKCDFYGDKGKPADEIAKTALGRLKEKDVLIFDSSGRNAFDSELADELKRIASVVKPDEAFLVVSADIGQIAKKQAEEFNRAVPLTGVIISKMDGSGKGGGALSAVAAAKAKIAFIGIGEKLSDMEPFEAQRFVGRLLGFPDIKGLMEKAKAVVEEGQLKPEMEEKFTIKSFYEQMRAAKKLGPLKGVFQMMGMPDMPKELIEQSEEKLKKFEAMVNSMTKKEREDASLIKKDRGRMERIAKGSGTKPEEVKDFISQFEKVEKLFGAFKSDRGFRRKMEKLMQSGALKFVGM